MNTFGASKLGQQNNGTNVAEAAYKIIWAKGSDLPEQYTGVVIGKFLTSLRNGCRYFGYVDPDRYFPAYRRYVVSILARPASVVRLAVLVDDPDVCLGWAILEHKSVHFVHVSADVRRLGIARALVPDPFDEFTHLTDMAYDIWKTKFPEAKFNPF